MGTKKKIFVSLVFLILNFEIAADEVHKSQYFSYWSKELKKFNYSLPDELKDRFFISNFDNAEIKTERISIIINKVSFPNETINYGIFIRSNAISNLASNVYRAFYFQNEKLSLVTSTALYIDGLKRYDFGGIIVRVGLTYEYDDHGNPTISCLDKTTKKTYYEIVSKQYCDQSIEYNVENSVIRVRSYQSKCNYGCIRYLPYLEPGDYFTVKNQVNLRKEPTSKSEVLKSLVKDTKIKIIDDTFKHEYFQGQDAANWVKVRIEDGGEGFIYGSFLRAPFEPDLVSIREKAAKWKK
ncbi:SH3 domain-containing protein [Leptospira bouyouniensis]|uniref:SH3 domain-containing protein n=1 Tax=Leptospira bouyouniensis TaxID=2484911 RepID=A0ABY2L5K6_9LEPT|nr:SH3 domain-containing protein [Leptospira bouyouniensis]TGK48028.1 SH3 domain-containing protein [Leptospira bouyouniensis]